MPRAASQGRSNMSIPAPMLASVVRPGRRITACRLALSMARVRPMVMAPRSPLSSAARAASSSRSNSPASAACMSAGICPSSATLRRAGGGGGSERAMTMPDSLTADGFPGVGGWCLRFERTPSRCPWFLACSDWSGLIVSA